MKKQVSHDKTGPVALEPNRHQRFRVIVDAHLLLINQNKVLLGLRQNTGYGDGAFHPPAGHLEPGESITAATLREAREEIGVTIAEEDLHLAHVMHNASDRGRIAFFFSAERWHGDPSNLEPHKCRQLRWFPLKALPEHMIDYARAAIEHYANGQLLSIHGW